MKFNFLLVSMCRVLFVQGQSDVEFVVKAVTPSITVPNVIYQQFIHHQANSLRGGDIHVFSSNDTMYCHYNVFSSFRDESRFGLVAQDSFTYGSWHIFSKLNDTLWVQHNNYINGEPAINYPLFILNAGKVLKGSGFSGRFYGSTSKSKHVSAKFIGQQDYRISDSLVHCYKIQFISSHNIYSSGTGNTKLEELATLLLEKESLLPVYIETIEIAALPFRYRRLLKFPFSRKELIKLQKPNDSISGVYECKAVSWKW